MGAFSEPGLGQMQKSIFKELAAHLEEAVGSIREWQSRGLLTGDDANNAIFEAFRFWATGLFHP